MEAFALILILISFYNCIQAKAIDNEIVETNSGPVRGEKLKTFYGKKEYYSFKGIPYAEPPINNLRYKPPTPVKPWNTTIDTLEFGNDCVQPTLDMKMIVGDENCLYLNIYSPDLKKSLPVMFYIHGGGYLFGSGNNILFGPDFLVRQDVVVVTINYRLGVAGFFSLGTPEISGNAGMKDQVLALNWINENIQHFGGDKTKITIFGESAGASSTNLLVLSPTTKGLYKRAIIMSGSVNNIWTTTNFDEQLKNIRSITKQLQPALTEIEDIAEFFQTYEAKALLNLTLMPFFIPGQERKSFEFWWIPIVEKDNHENTFISKTPGAIYEDESIDIDADVMLGITSLESLFFITGEILNPELLTPFDEHFNPPLPYIDSKLNIKSKDYKPIGEEIRKQYFGDKRVDGNSLLEYNELLSDIWFNYGMCKTAKQHAKRNGKTYFYRFSVEAGLNVFKNAYNVSHINGAAHGDELCYLFRCYGFTHLYKDYATDSIERKVILRLTKLFTNFAKYGNPTQVLKPSIDLKPVTTETINFVDIRNEGLRIAKNPNEQRNKFWDKLYEKYGTIIRNGH